MPKQNCTRERARELAMANSLETIAAVLRGTIVAELEVYSPARQLWVVCNNVSSLLAAARDGLPIRIKQGA